MDTDRCATTDLVAQIAVLARRDFDYFIEGKYGIAQLLQVTATGNALTPTAALQIVIDEVTFNR
ncbi:MAG: hypothetical protein WBQ78_08740 [Gammaproteobacteria bacterium]